MRKNLLILVFSGITLISENVHARGGAISLPPFISNLLTLIIIGVFIFLIIVKYASKDNEKNLPLNNKKLVITKTSEDVYEWKLTQIGLINLKNQMIIPRAQLSEADLNGVHGCQIDNSFLYGVRFIPTSKIRIDV